MAAVAQRVSNAPVMHGNLTQMLTTSRLARASMQQTPHTLTVFAGVSLQPYSPGGGIARSGSDHRADTLPATLRAATLTGAQRIVLEGASVRPAMISLSSKVKRPQNSCTVARGRRCC